MAGIPQDISKDEFNFAFDKILHLKHLNKVKHFMSRLLQNNLYFRNVTSNFADHTNQCYICHKNTDNIINFITCNVHKGLLNNLREEMRKIRLVSSFPMNLPYFFDTEIDANHLANVIFISTRNFLYSLRYSETIPNIEMVKWHVKGLSKLTLIMYPQNYEWHMTQNMFSNLTYVFSGQHEPP